MPTAPDREWFDQPDLAPKERGLHFQCTMCGNCCTGPEGYVLFTPEEGEALAKRLGMSYKAFHRDYTHDTSYGRSLNEVKTKAGLDCVFLDRKKFPGKAVCGVYEDRPAQCRTWPFWPSVVKTESTWNRAGRGCPGIDKGPLYPPKHIRLTRDRVDI